MNWKTINKVVSLILLPLFVLQGCGVRMIYAKDPYQTEVSEPKLIKTIKGPETITISEEQWMVIETQEEIAAMIPLGKYPYPKFDTDPGKYPYPKFDADPVWAVDKSKPNSFKAVEDFTKKNELVILQNGVDFPAIMSSGHNPPKPYLIPKGKYIVYKPEEQANGDTILHPVEVASCRNKLVWAPTLRRIPKTVTRTQKDIEIWSTETIERYHDVEKTNVLPIVALVAAGLVIIGILFFSGGTTAPVLCGAGGPVLIPVL